MPHQLERAADHRVHCTLCQWSWGGRASAIKTVCPGVPRFAAWAAIPSHLKTYTQLKQASLKTGAEPAGCIYTHVGKYFIWLYDEQEAVPRRRATPAQRAALTRARAVARANITCLACGDVARGRKEQREIRRYGLCEWCLQERGIRDDRRDAILTARKLLEQGVLVLDTETTGLARADTVIEIALLNVAGQVLLHSLVRTERSISPEAHSVHGLTVADLAQAPSFAELWPRLLALIEGRPVITYNSDFDERLLQQTAKRTGALIPEGWSNTFYCLMDMYAAFCGNVGTDGEYQWCSLLAACRQENIPPGPHRAVEDAQAALALLKALARKVATPAEAAPDALVRAKRR